jgi:hypothetical protein
MQALQNEQIQAMQGEPAKLMKGLSQNISLVPKEWPKVVQKVSCFLCAVKLLCELAVFC